MTLIAPADLARRPTSRAAVSWVWTAEHLLGRWVPLPPTVDAVSAVVNAVDGGAWPYTIVESQRAGVAERFFQVLGGFRGLCLEVGGSGMPWRVVVRVTADAGAGWAALPQNGGYWIPNRQVRADELLTYHEAASLGVAWLEGRVPEGEWATRRPRALWP